MRNISAGYQHVVCTVICVTVIVACVLLVEKRTDFMLC